MSRSKHYKPRTCVACGGEYTPTGSRQANCGVCGLKLCTKCNQVKSAGEFSKDKSDKAGLQPHCAECRAEYMRQWREDNKEHIAEYYQANKERYAEYYQANKERWTEYNRQWREDNPDKARLYTHKRRDGDVTPDPDQVTWALEYFDYKCPGCQADMHDGYHLDHWLPRSMEGPAGENFTLFTGNMVPLCPTCNLRKNSTHPWEFFEPEVVAVIEDYLLEATLHVLEV